jgi:hypothetical protein
METFTATRRTCDEHIVVELAGVAGLQAVNVRGCYDVIEQADFIVWYWAELSVGEVARPADCHRLAIRLASLNDRSGIAVLNAAIGWDRLGDRVGKRLRGKRFAVGCGYST